MNLNIHCLRNEKSSILPYLVLWFWGILLNPRQIKGSKEMITSIYTKLFVLFYHLFFLLDNGSFQDSCFFPVSNLSNITITLLCLHWL